MRSLLDLSHDIVDTARSARGELDDVPARDAADRYAREYAAAMGLDWDEAYELAGAYLGEVEAQTAQAVAAGIPWSLAQSTAFVGAIMGAILAAGACLSGIAPPEGQPDLYEAHPEIPAGGWICGHGVMVTVLGVDSHGRVAYQFEGKLERHDRRPAPDAFLDHFTRIDDVPVLGGEG